jgi:hypothetical protein
MATEWPDFEELVAKIEQESLSQGAIVKSPERFVVW